MKAEQPLVVQVQMALAHIVAHLTLDDADEELECLRAFVSKLEATKPEDLDLDVETQVYDFDAVRPGVPYSLPFSLVFVPIWPGEWSVEIKADVSVEGSAYHARGYVAHAEEVLRILEEAQVMLVDVMDAPSGIEPEDLKPPTGGTVH